LDTDFKPAAAGATNSSLSLSQQQPLARSSHGVSFLEKTNQLFIYGGEHVARTPIVEQQKGNDAAAVAAADDDTSSYCYGWLADLTNREWKALFPSSSSTESSLPSFPPSRIAHAQAVHVSTQTVYIFGGRAGITMQENALNDLWAWDSATHTWTEIQIDSDSASSLPEARSFHSMICVEDKLYVFGGCGQTSGRMADLHSFDLTTKTWTSLGASPLLKGRGGPILLPLSSSTKLAVVAGFCGHETKDGHVFDLTTNTWEPNLLLSELELLRPRSVSVSASFPTTNAGVCVIFGGEVDPSERGHEGAGGFTDDVVILNAETGALLETIQAPPSASSESNTSSDIWPGPRGWSSAGSCEKDGAGYLYVFGGLAGDDKKPIRLADLWELKVTTKKMEE